MNPFKWLKSLITPKKKEFPRNEGVMKDWNDDEPQQVIEHLIHALDDVHLAVDELFRANNKDEKFHLWEKAKFHIMSNRSPAVNYLQWNQDWQDPMVEK